MACRLAPAMLIFFGQSADAACAVLSMRQSRARTDLQLTRSAIVETRPASSSMSFAKLGSGCPRTELNRQILCGHNFNLASSVRSLSIHTPRESRRKR